MRPDDNMAEPVPTFGDRSAWAAALAAPCEAHSAAPGEPCYEVPRGLCRARSDAAPAPRRGGKR